MFYNSNLARCIGVKQGRNCGKKISGDTTPVRLSAKRYVTYSARNVIVLRQKKEAAYYYGFLKIRSSTLVFGLLLFDIWGVMVKLGMNIPPVEAYPIRHLFT